MKQFPLKNTLTVATVILGMELAQAAFGQQAWLFLDRSGQHIVAKAVGSSLSSVNDAGDLVSYAQTATAFALMARQTADTSILRILDKSSGQVTLSRPINARVLVHMSSPIEDIVLTDDSVYFVTLRVSVGKGVEPNREGGRLDLNKMTLADGTVQTFPLPADCHTSRLVNYEGIPLIYAWDGLGVWEFDSKQGAVKRLTDSAKLSDVVASEQAAERSRLAAAARGAGPGPFSDDVAIPAVGVFHLSRTGVLQKILDANLVATGPGRPAAALAFDLGADGQFAELISASFKGAPAIGALGTRNGNVVFEYLDGVTLRVQWSTTLPRDTSGLTLVPTPPDGITYVNVGRKQIETAGAAEGVRTVWNIPELDQNANPYNMRILTLSASTEPVR